MGFLTSCLDHYLVKHARSLAIKIQKTLHKYYYLLAVFGSGPHYTYCYYLYNMIKADVIYSNADI